MKISVLIRYFVEPVELQQNFQNDRFIANLLLSVPMNEIRKSVNII